MSSTIANGHSRPPVNLSTSGRDQNIRAFQSLPRYLCEKRQLHWSLRSAQFSELHMYYFLYSLAERSKAHNDTLRFGTHHVLHSAVSSHDSA